MKSLNGAAVVAAWGALAVGVLARAQSVDRLVPDQYPTIQAAINASAQGDRVLVATGTYVETIDFVGKGIEVRASGEPLSVTLRAPIAARAALFRNGEGPSSVLSGIRLVGNRNPALSGGGVEVSGASPTIENCTFEGIRSRPSAGSWGGALDVVSGSPVVRECVFEGNYVALDNGAGRDGGAVLIRGGTPSLQSCVFRDNPSGQGSDVFAVSSAAVDTVISDSLFTGSSGGGFGARIYNYGQGSGAAKINLLRCEFMAVDQNCISLVHGWDTIQFVDSRMQDCVVPDTATLFSQHRSTLSVRGSEFASNVGGTLVNANGTQGGLVQVEQTAFCGNTPAGPAWGPRIVDLGGNTVDDSCCPADINDDGVVNGADISVLLGYWGQSGKNVVGDITGDGIVNGADLALLLGSWGPCQ